MDDQVVTFHFSRVYRDPPVIVYGVQVDPDSDRDDNMRVSVVENLYNPEGYSIGAKLHVKRGTSSLITVKISVLALGMP